MEKNKETKVNEVVTGIVAESENASSVNEDGFDSASVVDEELLEGEDTGLIIERERYTKDGKHFWWYFVQGGLRGKKIRATITMPDVGGYEVLDLLFGDATAVPLYMFVGKMFNEHTKEISKYITYKAQIVEGGMVFSCKVKPMKDSDKSILDMLYRQQKLQNK